MLRYFCAMLLMGINLSPVLADGGHVNIAGNVTNGGCTIHDGTYLTFNLEPVKTTDLPSVDSVAGRQEKNISVICPKGIFPYFQFIYTPASGGQTVLKNKGTATGIGVELLNASYDDSPIHTLAYSVMRPTSAGKYTLAVHYIRTSQDMTPGTVESDAEYDLVYD